MNQHSSGAKNPIQKLEDFLALYLVKKAPYTIPAHAREKIVAAAPWIDLFLIVISIPLLLVLLGLNFAFFSFPWGMMGSPMMGAHMYGGVYSGWGIVNIVLFAVLALEILAMPGLFKRKKISWKLLMYASLITVVENILFFSIGGIVGGIIGLYLLFQVKEYYK
ncbi:MAG: chromate transporter [Candidatus Gracilibacteria bacterium]